MKKIQIQFFTKVASLFLIVAFVSACASSKQAVNSPLGTWEYVVKNTPYGNVEGQMIIEQQGDAYSGEIRSSQGNVTLDKLNIEGGKLKSSLMVDGNSLSVEGTFEGDSFTGQISAGSDNVFPMTASRAR